MVEKYDKLDFMDMVKNILENTKDEHLDDIAKQMHNVIDNLLELEKRYAKAGVR